MVDAAGKPGIEFDACAVSKLRFLVFFMRLNGFPIGMYSVCALSIDHSDR